MKKIVFLGLATMIIIACHKEKNRKSPGNKEALCAVINTDSIPKFVKDTFNIKYTGLIPIAWFNKDNNGYCVLFIKNGLQTTALFNPKGLFIREEIENNQNEENKIDNDTTTGCICELEITN